MVDHPRTSASPDGPTQKKYAVRNMVLVLMVSTKEVRDSWYLVLVPVAVDKEVRDSSSFNSFLIVF